MGRQCATCGRLVPRDWRPEEGKLVKECRQCSERNGWLARIKNWVALRFPSRSGND